MFFLVASAAAAKSLQWCPTLYDPTDYAVHGILQVRILKWVAVPFCEDLPNPGIEPRPLNTEVGSRSLL